MNEMKICAHVQALARHFLAYRAPLDELVSLLIQSMGENPAAADEFGRFLRLGHVQLLLQNHYETGLWCGPDGEFRLVNLALPSDRATAARRLHHRPPSPGTMCHWCFLDEKAHAARALGPELDVRGEVVPGIRLHPACTRAWRHLRVLAEQEVAHVG